MTEALSCPTCQWDEVPRYLFFAPPKDDLTRPHEVHPALESSSCVFACLPAFAVMVPSRRCLCSDCKCNCTSLPLKKTGLAGDADVAIGIEVTVGTLDSCESASQAPVFRLRTRSRGQQDCLQHREHLLSSTRNSDGPRYTQNEGSGEFFLRASGRHPNARVSSVETLFLRGLTTRTDGFTVTELHVT